MNRSRVEVSGERRGMSMMSRAQVAVRMTVAAPVSGALCALGLFIVWIIGGVLAGESVSAQDLWFVLVAWVAFAGPVGLCAGVALGVLPVVAGVAAWPRLERRLGMRRAIDAVAAVVAALGGLQSLVVAWAFTEDLAEAAGWALGAALVAAITARWVLRRGWRSAERLAERHAGTY